MKKGFTLIELLAVIVILAIIALIVTPIVINIITESKKSSFKATVESIKEGSKIYNANRNLTGELNDDKLVTITCTEQECNSDIESSPKVEINNPAKGKLYIQNDKVIFGYFISSDNTYIGIIDNDQVVVYDYHDQTITTKNITIAISNGKIYGQILLGSKILNIEDGEASILQPTPVECFNFDSSTGTIIEYYKNKNNDTSQEICPNDVVIPNKINNVKVKIIKKEAFYKKNKLTSLIILEGVETIGSWSFRGNSLTKLIIPSTVTSIESMAFYGNKISNIIFLGNKAIDIYPTAFHANNFEGENAFLYKHTDNGIDYSYLVSYIGNEKDVVIPQYKNGVQLKTIYSQAFYAGGATLEKVVLPEGVKTIGSQAFYMNNLTKVVIPSTVTSIESQTFTGNSKLKIIVNKSKKEFNWYNITRKGTKGISDEGVETTTFVTGKLLDADGNIVLTVTDTE